MYEFGEDRIQSTTNLDIDINYVSSQLSFLIPHPFSTLAKSKLTHLGTVCLIQQERSVEEALEDLILLGSTVGQLNVTCALISYLALYTMEDCIVARPWPCDLL